MLKKLLITVACAGALQPMATSAFEITWRTGKENLITAHPLLALNAVTSFLGGLSTGAYYYSDNTDSTNVKALKGLTCFGLVAYLNNSSTVVSLRNWYNRFNFNDIQSIVINEKGGMHVKRYADMEDFNNRNVYHHAAVTLGCFTVGALVGSGIAKVCNWATSSQATTDTINLPDTHEDESVEV